jgi:hypothetical protein
MPFKNKEDRNKYMRQYYKDNPEKYERKKQINKEYMKKRRLDNKLNKEDYYNNLSYAGEKLI